MEKDIHELAFGSSSLLKQQTTHCSSR